MPLTIIDVKELMGLQFKNYNPLNKSFTISA